MSRVIKVSNNNSIKVTGNSKLAIKSVNSLSSTLTLLSNKSILNNNLPIVNDNSFSGIDYFNLLNNNDKVYSVISGYSNNNVSNLFDNKMDTWLYGWHSSILSSQQKAIVIYQFNSPKTVRKIKFFQPGEFYRSSSLKILYGNNGLNDDFQPVSITSINTNLSNMNFNESREIDISPVNTQLIKFELGPDPNTGQYSNIAGLWEIEIYGYI